MAPVIRVSDEVFNRLAKHNPGFDSAAQVIGRLLDQVEGIETQTTEPEETFKPNRKQFVQSVGATCKNWNWSWSFVNHDEKFILFGAWTNLEDENGQVILSERWRTSAKGRRNPGFGQALEHLELVQNEGYQLKTFLMSGPNGGEETARIESIEPNMIDGELKRIGDNWYAQ